MKLENELTLEWAGDYFFKTDEKSPHSEDDSEAPISNDAHLIRLVFSISDDHAFGLLITRGGKVGKAGRFTHNMIVGGSKKWVSGELYKLYTSQSSLRFRQGYTQRLIDVQTYTLTDEFPPCANILNFGVKDASIAFKIDGVNKAMIQEMMEQEIRTLEIKYDEEREILEGYGGW